MKDSLQFKQVKTIKQKFYVNFMHCYFFQITVIVKHPLSGGNFLVAAIFSTKVMGYLGELYIVLLLTEKYLGLLLGHSVKNLVLKLQYLSLPKFCVSQ